MARSQRAASPSLSAATLEHLAASGLSAATIAAAGIRDEGDVLTGQLLKRFHIDAGFLVPYYGFDGSASKHFRLRDLAATNGHAKYVQPKASGNHLYIPPKLLPGGWWKRPGDIGPLYITEGEKKALKAAQEGLPCIALGGVYSWRTYSFKLPRDAVELEDGPSNKVLKVQTKEMRLLSENVVPELHEINWRARDVVLIFDSDVEQNEEVALAAFDFASWMGDHGAQVRQVFVPQRPDGSKRGLDDWLAEEPEAAQALASTEWLAANAAPPLPPDARAWVREQLNAKGTARTVAQKVAGVALGQLDEWGQRYRDAAENYYYFDNDTSILHEFRFDAMQAMRNTSFGRLLSDELGMHTADTNAMSRFADLFVAAEPIRTVQPHRVVATAGDALYYQVSDGRLAKVTARHGIEFVDNGTDGMLFLPSLVEPLDEEALIEACAIQEAPHRWRDALGSVNLQPLGGMSLDESKQLLECLFYLSPWLNRWRRFMPPLEVAVAEPNSGKTFLYNLRKGVLTGRPDLEGLPDDFRGWVSAASAAPGMWICDNLGNVKADYWHRLNDELARLITDPKPTVDLRQLYTTRTVQHIPIEAVFAVTTIKNPFTSPDVLQRALVYNLKAIPIGDRDAGWYERQLADRTGWVAEHLIVLAAFFEEVSERWDEHFMSGFRLVNFEQCVLLMGSVLGYDMTSAVEALPKMVTASVAEYDPVIEALVAFSRDWGTPRARLQDVVDWVGYDEEDRYSAIRTLGNSVLLGRYIKSHEYDVEQATDFKVLTIGATTYLVRGQEEAEQT